MLGFGVNFLFKCNLKFIFSLIFSYIEGIGFAFRHTLFYYALLYCSVQILFCFFSQSEGFVAALHQASIRAVFPIAFAHFMFCITVW